MLLIILKIPKTSSYIYLKAVLLNLLLLAYLQIKIYFLSVHPKGDNNLLEIWLLETGFLSLFQPNP